MAITEEGRHAEVDAAQQAQIRGARRKFIPMAATYSLGAFNDNFFKQAACLMALAAGRGEFQSYAVAVFTLPFILLAAPAGWLSDRFAKRHIVIAAKCLEVGAMLCGALGICTETWTLMLVMVGMMGLHSTIFGPALNGSIPELYPADYVIKANSILKTATTIAILLGIILSGVALGVRTPLAGGLPLGRAIVAAAVVGVAACGLLMSFFVPSRPAAAPRAKFPWTGPVDTVKVLMDIRSDRLLAVVIVLDAFVWFVAAIQVLVINKIGISQMKLGPSATGYLVVAELAGVALGGLLCGRIVRGSHWFRVLLPATVLLGAAMLPIAAVPLLPAWPLGPVTLPLVVLFMLLLVAGVAGGLLLVPLESFIQARPAPDRKGQVIAAGNFTAFTGILLAGLAFLGLDRLPQATGAFGVVGAVSLLATAWLAAALPKEDRA